MQLKRGFSLAEVLIAIAIIAILAALLFSAFAPAREKGRQTSCVSNLQSIYKALMLYAADNDQHERLVGLEDIPLEPFKYSKILLPYLGSTEVLFCPDTPAEKRKGWASSYNWYLLPPSMVAADDEQLQRVLRSQERHIRERGMNMTIIRCMSHQAAYYAQHQSDTDIGLQRQFVIDLNAAGAVKSRLVNPNE